MSDGRGRCKESGVKGRVTGYVTIEIMATRRRSLDGSDDYHWPLEAIETTAIEITATRTRRLPSQAKYGGYKGLKQAV
jgi:hypothetical protein